MITPLKDKIIVSIIEKEKITDSGIILSRADPAEVSRGIVLAIGSEVLDVAVGDCILPNWQKAVKTSVDGESFYIVKEEDVVLIFEDSAED
jgi:co-chaperonin GroES (HSP10)